MSSASTTTPCARSERPDRLVDIIRSNPSELTSFLSDHSTHLFDFDSVSSTVVDHLTSLTCSTLWQLHLRHIARLESVMQLCPPNSAAATALVHLLLSDKREGTDKLGASFCSSPFSNIILTLLRLSTQPASTFPLYPLAPSSASSLLSALFFSSQPHSQSVRQHIAVLLLLVRPLPLRQQLLSSLLLQCLSAPVPGSSSLPSPLSSIDLASLLSFLCHRVSAPTLLSSYMTALTNPSSSSFSSSSSLSSHRTFLNLFIHPRHFAVPLGRQLFDFFASTLSSALAQRQSPLFSLLLQLARHCITGLHANGAAAATSVRAVEDDGDWQLPRDYSAWFDEQFQWVTLKEDEEAGRTNKGGGGGRAGTSRKRKERYVLKRKDNEAALLELDEEDDEDEDGEQQEANGAKEAEPAADGAAVRREQRLQQSRRRKERLQQDEEVAQADKRRKVRQQEAAAERQQRVRFVLSCLFDSLASDETAVVTHYLHVVDRYWRGDRLLSEAEADKYCRCARIRIGGGSWTEGDAIVLDASQ